MVSPGFFHETWGPGFGVTLKGKARKRMALTLDANWRPRGLQPLCTLRTRLSARAACAVVFLKVLLRKAVERERRNRGFETWSRKAPHALRAAPAGELVAVDPDQAFTHTSLPFLRAFGIRAPARRVEHINRASAEGEILPVVADNVPWIHRSAK